MLIPQATLKPIHYEWGFGKSLGPFAAWAEVDTKKGEVFVYFKFIFVLIVFKGKIV